MFILSSSTNSDTNAFENSEKYDDDDFDTVTSAPNVNQVLTLTLDEIDEFLDGKDEDHSQNSDSLTPDLMQLVCNFFVFIFINIQQLNKKKVLSPKPKLYLISFLFNKQK